MKTALIVLVLVHVLAFIIGSFLWGLSKYREGQLLRVEWHSRKRGNIERMNDIGQKILMVTYLSASTCTLGLVLFLIWLKAGNS
jgi:hypothetical protein